MKTKLEYIWLDGYEPTQNMRSKTKVVEDFSDLSADLVHDDVVEGAQDTLSLLDRYVDEIDTILDKDRIKSKLKSLYIESSDLEA